MHSLSVANQTEQDTHKQCEKFFQCSMYETTNICTNSKYNLNLQAKAFFFHNDGEWKPFTILASYNYKMSLATSLIHGPTMWVNVTYGTSNFRLTGSSKLQMYAFSCVWRISGALQKKKTFNENITDWFSILAAYKSHRYYFILLTTATFSSSVEWVHVAT